MSSIGAAVARALVPALVLVGCAGPGPAPDEPIALAPPATLADDAVAMLTGSGTDVPPLPDARAALDQLAVKGRAPKTGYDRERFHHWADSDGDGCDSRADVLRRDALPGSVVLDDGCTVGATILDPYTGTEIVEEPGRASEVDIEHVVALSDAWQTGAAQWTDERREQYANDPLVIMAVDDEQNRKHSDGDAATWLPPRREYWCGYVASQIAIKAEYDLWVKPAERDAMIRVLDTCPGQRLPVRESGPLRG